MPLWLTRRRLSCTNPTAFWLRRLRCYRGGPARWCPLAVVLRAAGDLRAARDLNEDTFERLRQVLGPNHPDTLAVAHALAGDRSLLGDFDAAGKLYGDTHNRLRALRDARSRPSFICGTSLLFDREQSSGRSGHFGALTSGSANRLSTSHMAYARTGMTGRERETL